MAGNEQLASQEAMQSKHETLLSQSRKLEALSKSIQTLQSAKNPEQVLALYKDIKAKSSENNEAKKVLAEITQRLQTIVKETMVPSLQIFSRGVSAYKPELLRLAQEVFSGKGEVYNSKSFDDAIKRSDAYNQTAIQKVSALIKASKDLGYKPQPESAPTLQQVVFAEEDGRIVPKVVNHFYYEVLNGINNPLTVENYQAALNEIRQVEAPQLARSMGGGNAAGRGGSKVDYAVRISRQATALRDSIKTDRDELYIAQLEQKLNQRADAVHDDTSKKLDQATLASCIDCTTLGQEKFKLKGRIAKTVDPQLMSSDLFIFAVNHDIPMEPYLDLQVIGEKLNMGNRVSIAGPKVLAKLQKDNAKFS